MDEGEGPKEKTEVESAAMEVVQKKEGQYDGE
jgi:hypothetical protein